MTPVAGPAPGAPDIAATQMRECLVGLRQGKMLGCRAYGHLWRQRQKRLGIAAREVRHRDDLTLPPEDFVRERRDVAHVDAGAYDPAALADSPQGQRNEIAGRREQDRSVEFHGRRFFGGACPHGAQLACEGLRDAVAGAREGEHLPALPHRNLRDDVRRGAKAIETQTPRLAGPHQRAVADQAGAKQGRRLDVAVAGRQREDIALVGNGAVGIAAIDLITGEARRIAEVLAPRAAMHAGAARPAQPRHADTRPRREPAGAGTVGQHPAHDLVARHQR